MNENQEILLHYLENSESLPFEAVVDLFDSRVYKIPEVHNALWGLNFNRKQELEILAEFAKGGLKNEERR